MWVDVTFEYSDETVAPGIGMAALIIFGSPGLYLWLYHRECDIAGIPRDPMRFPHKVKGVDLYNIVYRLRLYDK